MERSLHRVSHGSRRAHPGLSFYLTTFGKCPRSGCQELLHPAHSAQRGQPPQWQVRQGAAILQFGGTRSGPFLPWLPRRDTGHRLRPNKPLGTTCCLAADAKCSWFYLTWLE